MKQYENDFPRLREASTSRLARELLSSAARDVAPRLSRQHAVVAAGVAAASLSTSGGAGATGALAATLVSGVKWLLVGFFAGAVSSVGALELSRRDAPEARQPVHTTSIDGPADHDLSRSPSASAGAPAKLLEDPTGTVTEPGVSSRGFDVPGAALPARSAQGAPAPSHSTARSRTDAVVPSRSFAPEPVEPTPGSVPKSGGNSAGGFAKQLELVDRARRAVSKRQPAEALSILDQLQREHGGGSFGPEATAIRIEALIESGNRSKAISLASRFIASHPDHPLVPRVRLLAGLPAGNAP
jgi:hypothetical protein